MAWRFEPGEGLRDAFRRVATEEIAKVRAGFTDAGNDGAKAIHEARQSFKRLRALLRLAETSLGSVFAAENRLWRDAGRQLAGSRDQTVLMETFDRVAAECLSKTPPGELDELRAHLAESATSQSAADAAANVYGVLTLLDEAEQRVMQLEWPDSAKALAKGLALSQARLRKKWKAARKSTKPHKLHEWRKRVKDQAAQLRLFRRVALPAYDMRQGSEKTVAELLGQEHDLWMLRERLAADTLPGALATARDAMLGAIEARRQALRDEALKLGKEFSAQDAKAFARELTAAWQSARPRRRRKSATPERAISPQP